MGSSYAAVDGAPKRDIDDTEQQGFYPQPRYDLFERAPGLTYRIFANERVVDALFEPDAIYNVAFTSLVTTSHYEFKIVSRSHSVYAIVDDADDIVVWYRRPTRYARELTVFPWGDAAVDEDVVLFTRDTNEVAITANLVTYAEPPDSSGATGYAILRVREINRQAIGVTGDFRRVLGAN